MTAHPPAGGGRVPRAVSLRCRLLSHPAPAPDSSLGDPFVRSEQFPTTREVVTPESNEVATPEVVKSHRTADVR